MAQTNGAHPLTNNTRPVPYDLEAERDLLAGCLSRPEQLPLVAALVEPSDFYQEANGLIFAAMLALHQRRARVGVTAVHSELLRTGQLERAGGLVFLQGLHALGGYQLPEVEDHARTIREASVKRQVIDGGGYISALGYEHELSADEVMGAAQSRLHAIVARSSGTAWQNSRELLAAFDARTDSIADGSAALTSGMSDLDDLTGGFVAPELTILAARPSMGKTAAALSIARHLCQTNKRVAFFSLEMSKEEIADRLTASVAGVDLEFVRKRRMNDAEWGRVVDAHGYIGEWRLEIDETGRISIDDLRNRALALYAAEPFDYLMLDYLQLVTGKRDRNGNREQEVASISSGLRALAKELRVPVLALSQLNREVETRAVKTPQLSDLRESGSLEQDAHIVIFLHRPAFYDPTLADTSAQLIVAKNRNGKTGSCSVAWNGAHQRFGNLDTWHERQAA